MDGNHPTSWFATLRRDGRLFAVVASLLVLVASVQPLFAAAEWSNGTICSFYDDEAERSVAEPCLACRIPGGCSLPAIDRDGAAEGLIFPGSTETALLRPGKAGCSMPAGPRTAASIRAPPSA